MSHSALHHLSLPSSDSLASISVTLFSRSTSRPFHSHSLTTPRLHFLPHTVVYVGTSHIHILWSPPHLYFATTAAFVSFISARCSTSHVALPPSRPRVRAAELQPTPSLLMFPRCFSLLYFSFLFNPFQGSVQGEEEGSL